jgi:hypothetical protein
MKTKDPRELLANVQTEVRQLHTNVLALRQIVLEKEANLIVLLKTIQNTPSGDPYVISQTVASMYGLLQRDVGHEYASVKAILELAENSEAFKKAAAEIDPLVAEIAELDAKEQARLDEQARNKAELAEALKAARKEALVNAELHPAVVAAKQKLSSITGFFKN